MAESRTTAAEVGPSGEELMARPWRWLRCIRFREVLILQGTPVFGMLFANGPGIRDDAQALAKALLFVAGGLLLMSHVFCLNDWAGTDLDRSDPNKRGDSFLDKGISRAELMALTLFTGAAGLLICALLSPLTLWLGVSVIALSLLYSHPRLNFKERPLLSSLVHLGGGVVHFSLGYSVWGHDVTGGIAIGLYFGVVFAAGHLNQEVRDHDSDRALGCRTNAVAFGKRPAFIASFALFSLSYACLFALNRAGLCPLSPCLAALLLYPLHLLFFTRTLRAGLTYSSASRFQLSYHLMYAFVGLFMAGSLLSA